VLAGIPEIRSSISLIIFSGVSASRRVTEKMIKKTAARIFIEQCS
jgi:hypothetical protein